MHCKNINLINYLVLRSKCLFSSKHKLIEIKNNSMLIIQDLQQKLPYMAEVQLGNQAKGIVMKIQDNNHAYIGMYQEFKTNQKPTEIQISKINKNWKSSNLSLLQSIIKSPSQNKGIYDVNNHLINKAQASSLINNEQQVYEIYNGKKRRVKSSSPILNICYDIYYGDMVSFMGCKGSKKSQNSWNIAKQFAKNNNNIAIYVNPYMKQVKQFSQICPSNLSFTVPQNQKPTDVGVYMLTLKAINLSTQLKRKGLNVLLIIDNLSDIMLRQWNLLQSIKFNSKTSDSSKLFQYNTLKISPISILNEIYSNCQDNNTYLANNKPNTNKTSKSQKGSLTSILISEKQNNQLIQQITSYSNNIKHLQTLSKIIQFPLNYKINTNLYYTKPKSEEQFNQIKQQPGFYQKQIHRFLRSNINKYLTQKKQTQLKRQLYKNDIRDAPWDYFFLLDAQWWTNGIKQISHSLTSFKQTTCFLQWIVFNIQNDYIGHWNLSAKQSYNKFVSYLRNMHNLQENVSIQQIHFTQQDLQNFIDEAKMQGLLNPFKKDYLM